MYLKYRSGLSMYFMLALMASLLVACSSGSDSNAVATSTVSGSVVAAPVAGASLTVKDLAGNTIAGPVITTADGGYDIAVPNASLKEMLMFESSGGSYTDEASGTSSKAGSLMAIIDDAEMAADDTVHLTPASTIVYQLVTQHGQTLAQAKDDFKNAFGFDADTKVAPADATSPADDASESALLAGLRAASFSQLTADLGLAADKQFDLLNSLAEDLADGVLDGKNSAGVVAINAAMMMPTDIRNRFSQALIAFHSSTKNKTGLANDKIGVPAFATVALSASYKVEYVPGMMAAMEGKTVFKLRISDDNGAVSGLTPGLMPMMHMGSGMKHSSPNEACTESTTAGEYDCTVYYLMASSMSNGMSMGYWELKVMPTMAESVTFYPQVMMSMGGTVKVTLNGQSDDQIAGMMMPENRKYYVFKEWLTGSQNSYSFRMLVAAKESMMNFPALLSGKVLNSGDVLYELTVNAVTLDVSTDKTNWIAAVANGNYWTASNITLQDNVATKLYIRLTVNGVQKTTDGLAPDGVANDYAVFDVTPVPVIF